MVFRNLCIRVIWTKVASALEGLSEWQLGVDTDASPGGERTKWTADHTQDFIIFCREGEWKNDHTHGKHVVNPSCNHLRHTRNRHTCYKDRFNHSMPKFLSDNLIYPQRVMACPNQAKIHKKHKLSINPSHAEVTFTRQRFLNTI